MLIRELVTKLGFKADEVAVKRFDKAIDGLKQRTQGLMTATNALRGAMAVLAVGSILKTADDFNALQGRVKLATEATGDFKEVFSGLTAISKQTAISLTDTADLFIKLKIGADELGKTHKDILLVANAVAKLGVIGNVAPQQMSAGLLQLGQALSSPIVQMQEFSPLMDSLLPVIKAVADELTGGSIGQLRKMVLDQKLTSEMFFDALMRQSSVVDETFSKMPKRLSIVTNSIVMSLQAQVGAVLNNAQVIERLIPLVVALGDVFLELLNPTGILATEVLPNIMDGLNALANGLLIVTEVVLDVVIALGGFSTVLSFATDLIIALLAMKATTWFILLGEAIATATVSMWGFVAAAIANPLVWIPLAIAAVVLLGKGIIDAMRGSDNWVKKLAVGAKNTLMGLFDWIKAGFKGMVKDVTSALPPWMQTLLKSGTSGFNFTVQSSPMVSPMGAGGSVFNSQPVINQTINMGATTNPQQVANTVGQRVSQALTLGNSPMLAMAGGVVG